MKSLQALLIIVFLLPPYHFALAQKPNQNDVLRIGHEISWGGKESLDPASKYRFLEAVLLLYGTLTRLDEAGKVVPGLAESWETDEAAATWTFRLRRNVKFHDGRPFSSKDVVYTITHILAPETKSPVASVLKLIQKTEAVAPDVVRFHLSNPYADLPILFTDHKTGIIPEGSADFIGKKGIGTGPFSLSALDIESVSVFRANPDYWEGPPKLSGIELLFMDSEEKATEALVRGEIDLIEAIMTTDRMQTLRKKPEIIIQETPAGDWIGLAMRTDTEPFKDARVRKALRIFADRQAFVETVLDGFGTITCDHPVWKGDMYRADFDCPPDIEEAKNLLREAGYPDGITVKLYAAPDNIHILPMAELYRTQAAKAGITIDIQRIPTDLYWNKTWMKESFFATFWYQRPADQILNEAWRSGASWNETYWNDPEFDKLLDQARKELDFEKRKSLYSKAQRMLYEKGGTFIPFHLNRRRAYRANVKGIKPVAITYIDWTKIEKLP